MTTYYFTVIKKNKNYKANQITTTNVSNAIKGKELEGKLFIDTLLINSGTSPSGQVDSNGNQTEVKDWLSQALDSLNAQVGSIGLQQFKVFNVLGEAMSKKEVYQQLKAGVSYANASGYSIHTLKELLSDLQPVNYKWLTYNACEGFWSASINGHRWATSFAPTESGGDEAYTQTVVELSEAIQIAERYGLLINPYTPEAVEGLILRVSEAIGAAARVPYMLKDLYGTGAAVGSKDFVSSDITINLVNKDADDQYILVFQKPFNVSEMYTTLFPVAWKVIPLGNNSNSSITYPVNLQITVKESALAYDAKNRGTVQPTPVGQLWQFYKKNDFPRLEQISGKTVDGLVGCVNNAAEKVDVAIAKDNKPLVVKCNVGQGDQANFTLTPKLYFAYASDLQEGDLIKSDVSASKTYDLDLTNLKSIDLTLSLKNSNTGLKEWITSNQVSAS
ncbi:hypothetical protein [Microcoleus sp. S13_C5]|uniref:hypothetical protein n=1 Tax=Microcoleus sp. S13_C5 TaxID=3055411 RepID=UPI002FD6CD76